MEYIKLNKWNNERLFRWNIEDYIGGILKTIQMEYRKLNKWNNERLFRWNIEDYIDGILKTMQMELGILRLLRWKRLN